MEMRFNELKQAIDRGGIFTMALTCLLAVASYFFGHTRAIELHWFWIAVASVCIVGSPRSFVRAANHSTPRTASGVGPPPATQR